MNYKSNIKKLYFFNFFKNLHFFGAVLVPFFLTWGKISYVQMMFLQSWFVIWITLLEVPTGSIADRFGRKTSIALGAFINAVAAIIYGSFPNFYIFLFAEFLWAFSFTLVSGADEALLYDSIKALKLEKRSKKTLGRYNSIHLLAIVIAAPIGSLISNFGLQYPTMLMSVPLSIACLIALTIKEPKSVNKEKNYFKILKEGITYFLKHKELKILAFDSISISVISFMIVWTYQPKLLSMGLAISFLGIVHSFGTLSEVLIQNNFDYLEKLSGKKKNYLLFSAMLIGTSFILLAISENIIVSILLVILIFGFGFTRRDLIRNYMHKHIKSENRATVISSVSMIDGFGRAIVYPIVGFLAQKSLTLCLIILGTTAIILSVFSRVEEKHLID